VAAEERAFHAVEQQVTLRWGVIFDRERQVELESVMSRGGLQTGRVVIQVEGVPTKDGSVRQALLFVYYPFEIGLVEDTQSGAGRAGPVRFVEGKVRHA
jgi:hypothetical protein